MLVADRITCFPAGTKKAPSWALLNGVSAVPLVVGLLEFCLQGVLEHLIFLRDVLSMIDLLEFAGPIVEDIALRGEVAALVDGGGLAVLGKIKVKAGLLW